MCTQEVPYVRDRARQNRVVEACAMERPVRGAPERRANPERGGEFPVIKGFEDVGPEFGR